MSSPERPVRRIIRRRSRTSTEPLTSTERSRRYRERQRQETASVDLRSAAAREFNKRFTEQEFGVACSVCDRIWFRNDLHHATATYQSTLEQIGVNVTNCLLCNTCVQSLKRKKIPHLATYNGFKYPPKPEDLPVLNAITRRLVSPRVPFMQIRRLRYQTGTYTIIGQIINVPIDVQTTVLTLPRHLDNDFVFNVSLKRNLLHKSTAYSGHVRKRDVRAWLDFLLPTPLYRRLNITIDWTQFENCIRGVEQLPLDEVATDNETELVLGNQQTVLWSEDKYLTIAPAQNETPLSIIWDEACEEMSFPDIYYGVERRFRPGIKVTAWDMATSEIRRKDRRGATPEHILYMAMKIMRMRITSGINASYRHCGDLHTITREMIENRDFVEECLVQNLAFLKSIPNSVQYWTNRKRELFAMMRQLGKPTFFLTLSANEINWPHLLRILHKLRTGNTDVVEDPLREFSAPYRADLVYNDAVTCCIYYSKLVNTIMEILKNAKCSPFAPNIVVDYFIRIEFQHRGSPHAHILLWLANDPKEEVSENMPHTLALYDRLCTVDFEHVIVDPNYAGVQVHKHTPTCYKDTKGKGRQSELCRFGIPYWPLRESRVFMPMAKEDGRRKALRKKGRDIKELLETNSFTSLDEFLRRVALDYDDYLNVIRASIKQPAILKGRNMTQIWTNTFNSEIANLLKSNMDLQFILEEYSCASYVVEYINKTNRGISNLQKELSHLQTDYPDQNYTELLKRVSLRMLDAVEMSAQEAAWYLLRQRMSEKSREAVFIPVMAPNERVRAHKSKAQMDEDDLSPDSTDVWTMNVIQKYEERPPSLSEMCLADFATQMTAVRGKRDQNGHQIYRERPLKRILWWNNYPVSNELNYKRSMVLLFYPFNNEHIDLLDNDKFLEIYANNELEIHRRRQIYDAYEDFEKALEQYPDLWSSVTDEGEPTHDLDFNSVQYGDLLARPENADISQIRVPQALHSIIKERTNVMTAAGYCEMMRLTNEDQRALIKHCIARIEDPELPPIQIFFTGPAGSGKTFTLLLIMETYNRFAQAHDDERNVYVAAASTGKAALALNGTTVHTAFSIPTMQRRGGLSFEALQNYRNGFATVRIVIIDEISMIGSGIFHTINERLKTITMDHETPFGGTDIIFCGDIRQLPPVNMTPIFEPLKRGLHRSALWQSLSYYPLQQAMRQPDVAFSNLLSKIGNGDALDETETALIESRFRTKEWCNANVKGAIRLFHKNKDVDEFNRASVTAECHSITSDTLINCHDAQLEPTARMMVHKMKTSESGNCPYDLPLALNQPYMITCNIDINDGIVNGAIGILRHIDIRRPNDSDFDEYHTSSVQTESSPSENEPRLHCLWLDFNDNPRIGNMARTRHRALLTTRRELEQTWTPIFKRSVTFTVMKIKNVKCRRVQFPLTLACAMTTHKSQGATFERVVFDYNKKLQQPLVYVAMSRVKTIDGLFLTNSNDDFKFYHARPQPSPGLIQLKTELTRLDSHKLKTKDHILLEKLSQSNITILNLNVQSLTAHLEDIITDQVLMKATYCCFTETWNSDKNIIPLRGFRLVTQKHEGTGRAGGVAIYENSTRQAPATGTPNTDALNTNGDLCAATISDKDRVIFLVTVYIKPNMPFEAVKAFFLNHATILRESDRNHQQSPLILCGDFNWNMKDQQKKHQLTTFLKDQFNLDLHSDQEATTRHKTCIDLLFVRDVSILDYQSNVTYFSYHKAMFIFI